MKMISVVGKFKHDGQTFHEGERRLVEDADAAYFCQHGWAKTDDAPAVAAVPTDVTLDVKSGTHVSKTKVNQ